MVLGAAVVAQVPAVQDLTAEPGSVQIQRGLQTALCLRRPTPGPAAAVVVEVQDPHILEADPGGGFLAGETRAFVQLMGRRPGRTRVTVRAADHRTVARVRVVAAAGIPRPVLRAPPEGAAVLGGEQVAVELRGRGPTGRLRVLLDGRTLAETRGRRLTAGLPRSLPPGVHRLEARHACTGSEPVGTVRILSVPASGGGHLVVEAEDLLDAPSPEGLRRVRKARVRRRRDAGGGLECAFTSSRSFLVWRPHIRAAGYYQLRARARGSPYLDFPRLGVGVGGLEGARALGSVVTRRPRLHALGRPLRLDAGVPELHVRFVNDAYDGRGADRNLYLDRLELVRVPEKSADVVPPRLAVAAPPEGARLGGAFTVKAEALDSRGAVRTAVHLGAVCLGRGGNRLAARIPADALPPGPGMLRISARDAAGNATELHRRVVRLPYEGRAPGRASPGVDAVRLPEDTNHRVVRDRRAPGRRAVAMWSGGPAGFPFQVPRKGRYRISIVARGDPFKGWPRARVRIDGGEARELEVRSRRYRNHRLDAGVHLEAGPHVAEVAFINDRYVQGSGDRNLYVAGLQLRQVEGDTHPPWVQLRRAPPEVSGVDLVIAEASDNDRVTRVELLVDGQKTGAADRVAPYGLWLRGDLLAPGTHFLQVRARDAAGHATLSPCRTFTVVPRRPGAPPSACRRAAVLVARLGLGGGRPEVERLLLEGEEAWLSRQLDGPGDPLADLRAAGLLRERGRLPARGVRRHLVQVLGTSRAPVRERLALFFDNHFNTWMGKTGARAELQEWRSFRQRATGSFRELLDVSARGYAMMVYLDNQENRRGRPNENYARELLELHTLGVHGGYDQDDVVALARIFTGWRAALTAGGDRFQFVGRHHDPGTKRALGVLWRFRKGDGPREGERLLDLLAAHPSTARFVCRKLAAHLVADDPPEDLVDHLAGCFLRTGGHVPSVVRALVARGDLFRPGVHGGKVKDPLELLVSAARAGLPALERAGTWLARLDHRPFDCVPPTGYPERGEAWMDSSSLLVRWNLLGRAAARAREVLPQPPGGDSAGDIRRAVELCALDLMARLPPREEVEAAVEALVGGTGPPGPRQILEAVVHLPAFQRH